MSEDNFTCNAPRYFDFSEFADDPNVDAYFELNQEEVLTDENICVGENRESVSDEESQFFSPMGATAQCDSAVKRSVYKLRKSLSLQNFAKSNDNKVDECTTALEAVEIKNNSLPHQENHLKKTLSQDRINALAQPRRFKSTENLNKVGFVSMAEAIAKFEKGTPKRFRVPPVQKLCKPPLMFPVPKTIPHTPNLMTKKRFRPNTALSREEQERLELEESKKFKIKANPVNKKILCQPLKVQVEKKPPTVVEPFKLTETKKTTPEAVEVPKPTFHAQPVPKSLHNPVKIEIKSNIPVTKAKTPNITKKIVKSSPMKKIPTNVQPFKPIRTTPIPFSFEKRDLEIKKKKEQLVQAAIEEEKKAREFHANPLPKNILKSRNGSLNQINECVKPLKSTKSVEELHVPMFKARPATVLLTKPFVPKKEQHVIEIAEFNLATEQRKQQRDEFLKHLIEKEQQSERLKQEQEMLLKQKEQEEIEKLRKLTEYKAQPIKQYKPVVVKPSNKLTNPVSPNFHYGKNKNKENVAH